MAILLNQSPTSTRPIPSAKAYSGHFLTIHPNKTPAYDTSCRLCPRRSATNQPQSALLHFRRFNTMMLVASAGNPQHKDMRLAVSWNELGNAHMMNKDWALAEECFLCSVNALKLMDNYTPVLCSFPIINLGFAYWLQGRLDEAETTLKNIRRCARRNMGLMIRSLSCE